VAKRVMIAGTSSGVGKTTLTIGIMAALKKRNLVVQGFKCGPDYIDPSYHTAVTKRVSRNIDSWMLSREVIRDIVERSGRDADISIIEGVMGYFDGKSPLENTGSAAEIAVITESPVLLVVDCSSMARSAAAIVKGFQTLHEPSQIVGVIANRVGSEGHFNIVKTAIEQECKIPVIGYMKKNNDLHLPSRHLGLIPAIERGELDSYFDSLAQEVEKTIDLNRLLSISETNNLQEVENSIFHEDPKVNVIIAVAKDTAFNFYYEENIQLLKSRGAEIQYFSPLANEPVPEDADGLYIGGGFPEEFAEQLANNEVSKQSIKELIENGLPTVAECGGFMYLTKSIQSTEGISYPMVGIIDGNVMMQPKLTALGYREIVGVNNNFLMGEGETAKGHEFHYSTFIPNTEQVPAYALKSRFGQKQDGCVVHSLIAGYVHFHFASNPKLIDNWLNACLKYQQQKRK